jgi:hypothetical protein
MDRLFGAPAPAPAPAGAVAGQPGAAAQPAQRTNPLFGMLRMAVMWYMVRQFMGSGNKQKDMPREQLIMPKLARGTPLDMSLYISEQPVFSDFGSREALIWRETDLELGVSGERTATYTYRPSQVRSGVRAGAAGVSLAVPGFPTCAWPAKPAVSRSCPLCC